MSKTEVAIQRPQCGTCADAGIICEVNTNRLARGPKKGDLKALRSRIVALERRLTIDGDGALTILTGDPATAMANDASDVIHEPSYSLCFQYAMWTLAMALSSQFESSREPLYAETRQMLETLEMTDDGLQPIPIEQVQAWLLVAFYELSRSSYRRASISAGRAFRLVQLARLHELDTPDQLVEGEDPVAKEEMRRTFWVAYCLDRLLCMRSNSPLTLSEEVICTRLPFMMAHATAISMCQIAESSGLENQYRPVVVESQQRATRAAREIAALAKAHEQIGYFKAHMFLPLAVSLAASQLMSDRRGRLEGPHAYQTQGLDALEGEAALDAELQCCMNALRKMQSFNNLARDYLVVLESQEFGLGL
ncbi:hypothetical protein N0V88_007858 [Collariella sp. IMI 366227]|nr:hypothetical protein N0V88_007858 [Collariella sp. IMI 366227]